MTSASSATPAPVEAALTRLRRHTTAYVALTKPRIIELLLVTTVPAMMLAAHGLPRVALLVTTLVGGSLAAGSANALNCYLDRDIDAVMGRTRSRPLSTGQVKPAQALLFGGVLGVTAVALFWLTTNALSALLAAAAIAFYVGVYTHTLKRRTSNNIVWGGAAGCMPVLIGWAAVRDSLGWSPMVLFAVVFLWTPPHFWALAMRYRADYARAKVPMLPVVATDDEVARQILLYSWAMVVASLALWPVASTTPFYPAAAAALGVVFLRAAYGMRSRIARGEPARSQLLFHWSITYLTLLSAAVAVDTLLSRLH